MNQFVKLLILCISVAIFGQCKKPAATERNRFENSEVSMQKDSCSGNCPVYFIRIQGTGKAVYEGIQNVKRIGKYEKQLSHKESSKLFNAFECANFFDFRSEYVSDANILPLTIVTFVHRGFTRTVKDFSAAPEELQHLEKMVEDIAMNDVGWVQIRE